jgi:tRNA threonylcarbamoyl adenosine modification protein YeaZ
MKNILAVTACLKRCSVAIAYEGSAYEANEDVDSAANLVYLASNLFEENKIDLKNIQGIITSSGPGSFTGIRVAQSFVKGIALSQRIPAASVSYFDVINNIYSEKNPTNKKNKFIAIKSEKDQIFFANISCDASCKGIGVSSYENINNAIVFDDFVLLGNANFEIMNFAKGKNIISSDIMDFKSARHFLNFSNKITSDSKVVQLYINARSEGTVA